MHNLHAGMPKLPLFDQSYFSCPRELDDLTAAESVTNCSFAADVSPPRPHDRLAFSGNLLTNLLPPWRSSTPWRQGGRQEMSG